LVNYLFIAIFALLTYYVFLGARPPTPLKGALTAERLGSAAVDKYGTSECDYREFWLAGIALEMDRLFFRMNFRAMTL
jgi:hypothetical protein